MKHPNDTPLARWVVRGARGVPMAVVDANTASEARAAAKRRYNLKRLPVGVTVVLDAHLRERAVRP